MRQILAVFLIVVASAIITGGCDTTADTKRTPHLTAYQLASDGRTWIKLGDTLTPRDSALLHQEKVMRALRENNPKWQNREKLRRGMTIAEVEKLMGTEWELYRRRRASQFYAGQCYEELCRWKLDSLQDMELTFFTCDGKDSSDRVLFSEARSVMR